MHRLNEALGFSAIQGTMLTIIFLCSTSIYGSLKFYHDLSLRANLIFPSVTLSCVIVALIIIPIGGHITGYSRQFRYTWNEWNAQRNDMIGKYDTSLNHFKEQSIFHKLLASCAEVQAKMGIFYGYTTKTTVAFIQICVDNSINLVLTF
jgi:hypothetical protein